MNCLEPAPTLYLTVIRCIQLASIPTYIIALISLIFIKTKVFTTYRIFLVWHVVENFVFEIYSAFLVAPVLHAPYPLMRMTGILSKFGVGSLYQFFMLAFAIEYNGLSISEMFWFRYKSSFVDFKQQKFTYLLRFFVYSTRLVAIFETVFPFFVVPDALEFQQEIKATLLKLNPQDTFLACDPVYVIAAFRDYVSSIILASWILQAIFFTLSLPGTAIYISLNLPKTMSEVTLKLQQQLLKSLIIQASIHGIMLGIPNVTFIYTIMYGYENESLAYIALGCLTYHGFVSSLAMIIFTKPLREFILGWCKKKKKSENAIRDKRVSVY